MATYRRLYNDRHWFPGTSGNSANAGGLLHVFLANSSTRGVTYNSSTGATPNANPLTLDAAGRLQSEVWVDSSLTFKLQLALAGDGNSVTPPASPLWTELDVAGINSFPSSAITGEWIASGFTPTFVSATSFTVTGDQTAILHVGRRLQIVDSGGTKYATITVTAFAAGVTTVTVLVDSGGSLANPITSIAYGLVSSVNTSIPFFVVQNIYPISAAPNAFFQVDQLVNVATSVADDNYGHDHWYVLTQTASVQVSTQTLQENGQSTNARLTQNQAAAQRMGYACIIEAKEAQKLRGQTMAFRPRVRCSSAQTIRCAVLEWTGTADSVTSDIVNDWTSSDYSDGAGKFFVDASLIPLGTAGATPGQFTDFVSLPVTIGNGCNNIILFIWTEGAAAQNVTLDIGKVRFVLGTFASDLYIPTFDETLRYAMRFYEKSFGYTVAPAQGVGTSGDGEWRFIQAVGAAVAGQIAWAKYRVPKRTTPVGTLYNPAVANAQVRNLTTASDCAAAGFNTLGTEAFNISFTTAVAGSVAGNVNAVHWTADARL
jgi:hypothetical protein